MDHDEGLVQDIVAHPEDTALRLIYADWLEERDDPRSEFLRLEAQLAELKGRGNRRRRDQVRRRLRELRAAISPDWLARLDRTAIENCEVQFAFRCPKRWENLLQVPENNAVRFCETCYKNVYFCWTVEEAQRQAALGNCVAVDSRLERTPDDLRARLVTLGIIAPPVVEREREVPDRRHDLVRPLHSLQRGDRVRVINGRWEGRQGVIQSVNRSGTHAIVRLQMGDRRVGFSVDDLERD
jgi:uncharacterized protein (TIGR02996 family)